MQILSAEEKIIELKGKSLGYLSMLIFVLLLFVSLFAFIFPDQIPEGELPSSQLIGLCLSGGLVVFLGDYFSFKKKLTVGYLFFFAGFFSACVFAIYMKQGPEPIQNSMIALAISILVATYFLRARHILLIVISSLVLINFSLYMTNVKISEILISYIFFNIFCAASLWISNLKDKSEDIIIGQAEKDAKLKEIGFVSSSIIHEIINPLAVIRQSLEVISTKAEQSENGDVSYDVLAKYLDMAQRHSINIHEIITSISSLVKYNPNEQLPIFNTFYLLKQLQQTAIQIGESNNIEISFPSEFPDFNLEGKESEVLKVLTNLIRNSCAAVSETNGKVWIQILETKGQIIFEVCDNGPGISDDIAEHLGVAFNSGTTEGLGLGLSISMALAEKNLGRIQYSKKTDITKFILSLPTNRVPTSISSNDVLRTYSGDYAHLFALREDLILIVMRDVKLELSDFKILMMEEFEVVGETPFHYIVITHNADLSKQTRDYFNTPEMTKLFLSGSIVGQGQVVSNAVNFFTRILKLPYPVKMFKEYDDAISWINTIQPEAIEENLNV